MAAPLWRIPDLLNSSDFSAESKQDNRHQRSAAAARQQRPARGETGTYCPNLIKFKLLAVKEILEHQCQIMLLKFLNKIHFWGKSLYCNSGEKVSLQKNILTQFLFFCISIAWIVRMKVKSWFPVTTHEKVDIMSDKDCTSEEFGSKIVSISSNLNVSLESFSLGFYKYFSWMRNVLNSVMINNISVYFSHWLPRFLWKYK